MTFDRYGETIAADVAALERGIRAHIVDLDEAFSVRDWATVARIYRTIAGLADRLEALDPVARSRVLDQAERAQAALDAAYLDETDELDEVAMRGADALSASQFLDPDASILRGESAADLEGDSADGWGDGSDGAAGGLRG